MKKPHSELDKIRHPKQRAFLSVYAESCNVVLAARAAKIARALHYYWLDTDPDYARAFEQAKRQAVDILEAAAMRRAVSGVPRYRVNGGTIVRNPKTGRPIIERHYSDMLLKTLLEANAPEKYRRAFVAAVEDDGARVAGRTRADVIAEEIAARQSALDMLNQSSQNGN